MRWRNRNQKEIEIFEIHLPTFEAMNTISLFRIFSSFFKLGITSFGGPAMIVHIRELAVEKQKWLSDLTFKNGVALSQMIPGASAMQTAAYVGLKLRGTAGAAMSFLGFGLPAFIIMMIFSILYQRIDDFIKVISIFTGLHAIIVAIIANAAVTFGRNLIKDVRNAVIAFFSGALFLLGINPMLAILLSAVFGILINDNKRDTPEKENEQHTSGSNKFIIVILSFAIGILFVLFFLDRSLFDLSFLMLRIDLFAFGGGFSSIPLMYHEVVEAKSWLDSNTLLNGIAIGQITPGPIVITATFIGYMTKGWLGAVIATISIFLPSFMMVIGIEPHFNKLRSYKYFNKAVSGVLCSFVGLLVSVAVSFALNISWNYVLVLLAISAFIALIYKVNILLIVLLGTVISAILL